MRYNHYGVISEISDLPGCGQIGVSHYVWTEKDNRGKGQGFKAHQDRLDVLKLLGYDCALCTVDMANSVELRILGLNSWRHLTSFKSSKTGNTVGLFAKGINSNLQELKVPDVPKEVYYSDYEHPDELKDSIGAYGE